MGQAGGLHRFGQVWFLSGLITDGQTLHQAGAICRLPGDGPPEGFPESVQEALKEARRLEQGGGVLKFLTFFQRVRVKKKFT